MRIFCGLLLIYSLIACDGLDLDQIDSDENIFTNAELQNTLFFSSDLLQSQADNDKNLEGIIAVFKSSSLFEQIALEKDKTKDTIYGTYDWQITNNELRVTYQDEMICNSNKNTDDDTHFSVTTNCETNNQTLPVGRIKGTLYRPLEFTVDDLYNRPVSIEIPVDDEENKKETLAFADDNEFTETDDDNNSTTGTFKSSLFENVVEINLTTDADEPTKRRLLSLISGNILDGRMLELNYITENDEERLSNIRIYATDNNTWEVISSYTDFEKNK